MMGLARLVMQGLGAGVGRDGGDQYLLSASAALGRVFERVLLAEMATVVLPTGRDG